MGSGPARILRRGRCKYEPSLNVLNFHLRFRLCPCKLALCTRLVCVLFRVSFPCAMTVTLLLAARGLPVVDHLVPFYQLVEYDDVGVGSPDSLRIQLATPFTPGHSSSLKPSHSAAS